MAIKDAISNLHDKRRQREAPLGAKFGFRMHLGAWLAIAIVISRYAIAFWPLRVLTVAVGLELWATPTTQHLNLTRAPSRPLSRARFRSAANGDVFICLLFANQPVNNCQQGVTMPIFNYSISFAFQSRQLCGKAARAQEENRGGRWMGSVTK